MIVLGIDPGGSETGLVVRDREAVLHFRVYQRDGETMGRYCNHVANITDSLHASFALGLVAVEGVAAPNWYHQGRGRPISVTGLLGTAQVLGAVLARFPGAVVVPPGGNSSGALAGYPAELVGPREKSGGGVLRHARSAWDVSLAGERLALYEGVFGGGA